MKIDQLDWKLGLPDSEGEWLIEFYEKEVYKDCRRLMSIEVKDAGDYNEPYFWSSKDEEVQKELGKKFIVFGFGIGTTLGRLFHENGVNRSIEIIRSLKLQ